MESTDKVLGTISAMNTLIENFPMSILDMMKGKQYTSMFDFVVDVLNACGVNTNEIIDFLLQEIYGIESSIQNGREAFLNDVRNGSLEVNAQNEFLQTLEMSMKGILMAILSSIFSCSAIPVIPNKMFDGADDDMFPKDNDSLLFKALKNKSLEPFLVPTNAIDPMGMLKISPTSDNGRLLYAIEGSDIYYKKEFVEKTTLRTKIERIPQNVTKTIKTYKEERLYTDENQIGVYMELVTKGDEYAEDINIFKITSSVTTDILIRISYSPYGDINNVITSEFLILEGETSSDLFILSPKDMHNNGQTSVIHSITINGGNGFGCEDKWVYLDREKSNNIVQYWSDNNAKSLNNINWGSTNEELTAKEVYEEITTTEETLKEVEYPYTEMVLKYVECEYEDITAPKETIIRVDFVSEEVNENDADYIVCYEGLNPNTLYKTMDMNAFLWYVLHKGTKNPQIEYNHMMWDSRISAKRNDIFRKSDEDWNSWYSSKTTYTDEFKYENARISDETPFYPIIQLEPQGMAENEFRIHLPSQRYLMPSKRRNRLNNIAIPKVAFNSSIYKFNWDYLNNIQILNPKLLLVGLCESLLGFSLTTISSIDINFTKKIIESKLSSAIKKVIEANDMEVEDCYMEFSNDEVNIMMEEMLLSRYSATTYGGETSTVRVHNVSNYIDKLDKININAAVAGNTTQIKKLITEVTGNPSTEGSIDYGLQVSTDGNILKKLLWSIIMPILLSIFTPQVILLLYINFDLMGLLKSEDFLKNDFGMIFNLILNKIFALVKSIILFIKDKIIELLLVFFFEKIVPLLVKYEMLILLERLGYWLEILKSAISCMPTFKFKRNKTIGSIDDVNYADIINVQETPESVNPC